MRKNFVCRYFTIISSMQTFLPVCSQFKSIIWTNLTKKSLTLEREINLRKQYMFKTLFYPSKVKFYADIVRASVTNSMSGMIFSRTTFWLCSSLLLWLPDTQNINSIIHWINPLKDTSECWSHVAAKGGYKLPVECLTNNHLS